MLAIATLVVNILDVVAIALLGLVAALALGGGNPPDLPFLGELDRNTLVLALLIGAGLLFAIKTFSGLFLTRIRQNFLASLEVYYSEIIANSVFTSGLRSMKRFSRPALEWTILRSTSLAFGSVVGAALALFAEASLAILILALFFYTDWLSALLVMGYFSLVLAVFQLSTHKKVQSTGSAFTDGSISVGSAISDLFVSYREIVVSSRLQYFLRRLLVARNQVARGSALQNYMQQIPRLVVELALILGAIGFAALQFATSDGKPDLALISVFIVGSLRIMSSLLPLYRSFMQIRYEAPQAKSSQDIVREAQVQETRKHSPPEFEETSKKVPPLDSQRGIAVSFSDVSFSYDDRGASNISLKNISLRIEEGSTVAIIGPSGAGKSTLVDLMLGLLKPSKGQILCSGFSPDFVREAVPGLMSYVPQKPGLISGTVRDNIALGIPPDEIDEISLWRAIRLARIEEFVKSLPSGVDEGLGEQGDALSGGQMQRLGLARSLYTAPKLLILDEATSALDAETEASISESLDELRGHTTTVVVAHRLSTVQHADVVFVIDKGELIASGSLKELEKDVPLVKRYISLMSLE